MNNGLKACGNVVDLHTLETVEHQTADSRTPESRIGHRALEHVLEHSLENTLEQFNDARHDNPPAVAAAELHCGELLGTSAPMQHLFDMIRKVAPTRANVMVTGESGTGKELVAGEIHRLGREAGKPFIALNCGAISPQLIEAELFGHERGSFTGAVRAHKGCFERAHGGTLFLDELTEMPMDMQVKLLRVLETGSFCRVGADEETRVAVRVIAATNRDPKQAVDAGSLRADLYYRLAVFPIVMPPLRERGSDINLLAQVFLNRLNDEEHTGKVFSRPARRFLQEYAWPGNVRELKNMVHRAYILADRELDLGSAAGQARPAAVVQDADCITFALGSRLAEAEQKLICATLGFCGGNKTQTAEVLGVSLKTLYNRLNEYQAKIPGNETRPHGGELRNEIYNQQQSSSVHPFHAHTNINL